MLNKRNSYYVKVLTVDTELELTIASYTTGMQLFNQICETIGLREIWYFGLQYEETTDVYIWLDLARKVSKQIGERKNSVQFTLKAKYFPEDASTELICEKTQQMFYLQVKESILSGEIYCPTETAILLASYACQVKFGDYDPQKTKPGFLKDERLLPDRVKIDSEQSLEQLEASIVRWYKEHEGKFRSDAMIDYLHTAQDLEMYGVTYFPIRNKRGTNLLLGVDAFGLNIYPDDNRLTPKLGFPWSEISKVSFKKHQFIIKPVDKSGKKLVLYSTHTRRNQQMLSICVGTHELYMRRRKEEPVEVQHMRAQAKAEKAVKIQEREKIREALCAQQEAERQLQTLRANLITELTEQEQMRQHANELEKRVKELEQQLQEEAEIRRQMELAQERLKSTTDELQATCKRTEEERQKLMSEKDSIQQEITRLTRSMERSSVRLTSQSTELRRLAETCPFPVVRSQLLYARDPEALKEYSPQATIENPQSSLQRRLNTNGAALDFTLASPRPFSTASPRIVTMKEGVPTKRTWDGSTRSSPGLGSGNEALVEDSYTPKYNMTLPQTGTQASQHECKSLSRSTNSQRVPNVQYAERCFDLNYIYKNNIEPLNNGNFERTTRKANPSLFSQVASVDEENRSARQSTMPVEHAQANRIQSSLDDDRPMNTRDDDRFRTLRNIRQGNTKRRVDEFESM